MKLTNKIFPLLTAAVMVLSSVSCDEFLDREPSKNTNKTVENADQLDALLGTYAQFNKEYNHTALACDDFGMTPEIGQNYTSLTVSNLNYILWGDTNSEASRLLWSDEYKKIFYANLVLNYIDDVAGDPALKNALKAEAHFIRAYSMFQLALVYTLYYDGSNGSELGLPLKRSISFEENVARASLEQTWAFIDNDLNEALKSEVSLTVNGARRTWRASRAGINAFAARYYLYRGDFDRALSHVNAVLGEYSTLKDFNTSMSYHTYTDSYTINTSTNPETVVVKYPKTFEQVIGTAYRNIFEWEELLYSRTCSYASWWYIPSQDLLDCFAADAPGGDPMNDLRYEYFICEDVSLRYCSKDPAFRYPAFCQFYYDEIISGPTVAEMLLIKAEIQARRGSWQEALTTIAPLRQARIKASEYTAPAASSQAEALKFILRERRREMPFTMRWYDLKRLNANDDPSDNVTITRTFYPYTSTTILKNDPVRTYTLEPGSRHYALPIPTTELELAKGVIEQNRY